MTEKELEEMKITIRTDIDKLKKDVNVLNDMIEFVENNLENLTVDNADIFYDRMDEYEEKLDIVELFS